MIRLFISDLDHTLLNTHKQIEPSDRKAIQQLIDAGMEVGLASGRTDSEIKYIGDHYLHHACHRISENGVFVYTAQDEKLFSTTLSYDTALQIVEKSKEYSFLEVFNVNNKCFIRKKTDEVMKYENVNNITIEERPQLFDEITPSFALTKIAFIGELSDLKQFEQVLSHEFAGQVTFHISSPNCLDVIPQNISKGSGLDILLDHLQLTHEEMACVGDSYNDIAMLQATSHSFAMAHGEKQVRDSANHTVHSVTEVVDYIVQHNLQSTKR